LLWTKKKNINEGEFESAGFNLLSALLLVHARLGLAHVKIRLVENIDLEKPTEREKIINE
jgi:hypothetical protein